MGADYAFIYFIIEEIYRILSLLEDAQQHCHQKTCSFGYAALSPDFAAHLHPPAVTDHHSQLEDLALVLAPSVELHSVVFLGPCREVLEEGSQVDNRKVFSV